MSSATTRRISPKLPVFLYLQLQKYRQTKNLRLRAIVEAAIREALEYELEPEGLQPEKAETPNLSVELDLDLFVQLKAYCARHGFTQRAFVAGALQRHLSRNETP